MWLLLFVAVLLVVTYLLLPSPATKTPDKAGLDDFDFPTNQNDRVMPILYGCVWMHGNALEIQNLKSKKIKA